MEHFYSKIHGWFTFPQLYKSIVEKFDSGVFVEVGTWKGKSAAYMAVEIANSNKNIEFYCIDPWTGETNEITDVYVCEEVKTNTLYEHFLSNIEPVSNYIKPIKKTSLDAVEQFQNCSLDFVFIDASHDYESVKADVEAWHSKIKIGGVLAGHDYSCIEVKRAVNEFADKHNLQIKSQEDCWVINI